MSKPERAYTYTYRIKTMASSQQNQNHTPEPEFTNNETSQNGSPRDERSGNRQERMPNSTANNANANANSNTNSNNGDNFITITMRKLEVQSIADRWMQEMAKEIGSSGLERMPQGFWPKMNDTYNRKFNASVSQPSFKTLVKNARRTVTETNSEQEGERNRAGVEQQPVTHKPIQDPALYKKLQLLLAEKLKVAETGENRVSTRRIQSREVDGKVFEYLNNIIEREMLEKTNTLKQINDLIYAAQVTYEEVKAKVRKKSEWKESIEGKIREIEKDIQALEDGNHEVRRVCRRYKIHSNNNTQVETVKDGLRQKAQVYKRKIEVSTGRIQRHNVNRNFEVNRKRFYREAEEAPKKIAETLGGRETMEYWEKIWERRNDEAKDTKELVETLKGHGLEVEISDEKLGKLIKEAIRFLPNWKAAGPDRVYNFFIKKLTTLHNKLIYAICKAVKQPDTIPESFYTGITYLIPKKDNAKAPDELRPITCLPNMYKLISKVNTEILYEACELNNVISNNQMGARRRCLGAKQQALTNKYINERNEHLLKTSWIDIRKAFDSVNHQYLIDCLNEIRIPECIVESVKRMLDLQNTRIHLRNEMIGQVKIENGIMQGDSLSPLLFVIVMEPVSRMLNRKCSMIEVDEVMNRNHLIFVDDIKLFAISTEQLENICQVTKDCLEKMAMNVNQQKSASNIESENVFGSQLDDVEGYKYLGVLENSANEMMRKNKQTVKVKIMNRVRTMCNTKLNAKNLFKAINEFAISTINYYVGVLNYRHSELEELDKDIRRILAEMDITRRAGNMERLYLSRKELGRGLKNINESAESMLLGMHTKLRESEDTKLMLVNEEVKGTILGQILKTLNNRYQIETREPTARSVKEAQKLARMERISRKALHKVVYEDVNSVLDLEESSKWMKQGDVSPKDEGLWMKLQDRNWFHSEGHKQCHICRSKQITVDHLATRCERLVSTEYRRRHDDILKSIHMHIAKRHGFTSNSKLAAHQVEPVLNNNNALIRVDQPIRTHARMEHNRPDIFILDKINNEITLIEVGVTNAETLVEVEIEKKKKYSQLAEDLRLQYRARTAKVVPVVMSWDARVTRHFRKHMKEINVPVNIIAYIQTLALKRTCEIVVSDVREGNQTYD